MHFDPFIRRVARDAYRRYRFAGTMFEREDLEQEAYLIVSQIKERTPEKPRAYLYRDTLKRLRGLRKDAEVFIGNRVPLAAIAETEFAPDADPLEVLCVSEVRDLVERLPEPVARVLCSFYGIGEEPRSIEEIAEASGRPQGAVKWQLHEGRGSLLRTYEEAA